MQAVRAELKADIGAVIAKVHSTEVSIVRWIVGTTIATAGLGFAIAKFAS